MILFDINPLFAHMKWFQVLLTEIVLFAHS